MVNYLGKLKMLKVKKKKEKKMYSMKLRKCHIVRDMY